MPTIQDLNPAMAEALRRRAGQIPSGVGISDQQGQSPSNIGNPIEQQGLNQMVNAQVGGNSNPTSNQTKALQNALPGEANMIIKQLSKTLDRLTPDPNKQMGV